METLLTYFVTYVQTRGARAVFYVVKNETGVNCNRWFFWTKLKPGKEACARRRSAGHVTYFFQWMPTSTAAAVARNILSA